MKNLVLALSLALSASAHAQLLVDPTFTSGSYQTTIATASNPASMASNHREADDATAFASGASQGGPIQGNTVRGSASFNNDFFLEFPPTTLVNFIRLRGAATSIASVGTQNPLLLQTTSSMNSRGEFDVTTEVHFDLSGSLDISGVTALGPGSAIAICGIHLTRAGQTYAGINFSLNALTNNSLPLNFSGTFTPGHYILETFATSTAAASLAGSNWAANATFDARLAFSPVPSPAPLALLTLAAIPRRRR